MDYDVVVIGGGPIGCAAARDIAAAGFRVLVAEEHHRIGEPLQCSGLISARTLEISRASSHIVQHELKGALVYAPGGEVLNLTGNRVYALAIDRVAFDRDLAGQAAMAGAEIVNCARVTGLELISGGIRVRLRHRSSASDDVRWGAGREELLFTRLVIGADGNRSMAARWLGFSPIGEKVSMYAAEVELPGRQDQVVNIFLGRQVAPGWFGWVIPAGPGKARVGIGADSHPRSFFQALVARYPEIFQGMRVIRGTSGCVRVGMLPRMYGGHTLLVGDAACHVKPISGGGLYLGLEAARFCAATAVAALVAGDYSEKFLARYQDGSEKLIGREIRCGLKHREIFLGLSDQEMDMLIRFFNRPYWRKLILKYGDIDYHSVLAQKLTLAPPWAQRFVVGSLKALLNR